MKNSLLILSLFIVLQACKKEEKPIPKKEPGDVIITSISLGEDYKWQVFYSLKNNKEVSRNLKTDWDLGFECSNQGFHVILNSAKNMGASIIESNDFENTKDTSGFEAKRKVDMPSGNLDSTAIGDWTSGSSAYIIDRGFDEKGNHLGFNKIKLNQVNETSYELLVSNLSGTNTETVLIPKDEAYNFTFLSFNGNKIVKIEPPKNDWDIVFTQYTHVFYNPTTNYIVVGCLHNRHNTQAGFEKHIKFSDIKLEQAEKIELFKAINTIGYDWKTYSFDLGGFITNSEISYIIKDQSGFFYKLRFTDFYDEMGVKGSPVWEFQEL